MITIYPFASLGHHQYEWLDARYHFSFGEYYDPDRMGFGTLRVVNDDNIKPHTGFGFHPHKDMEIITYVKQGAITHSDNKGNQGKTMAGDIQVMSAGTGIIHAEHNHEDIETKLYQIWIMPDKKNHLPKWKTHAFPKHNHHLELVVSGDGRAPLQINQNARLYAARMSANDKITHLVKPQGYLLVCEGKLSINNKIANKGDGVEITENDAVTFTATTNTEILLIEVGT